MKIKNTFLFEVKWCFGYAKVRSDLAIVRVSHVREVIAGKGVSWKNKGV